MSAPTILIVGNSIPTLREYFHTHGIPFIVLKDASTVMTSRMDPAEHELCDFSSPDSIAARITELQQRYHFDGLITTYERYIVDTARIGAQLGLPALPLQAAEACTNKDLMRQKFAAAPQSISPAFRVVQTEQDLRDFAAVHAFPLILKPANLSKSLLVSKANNLEELLAAYRTTLATTDAVYARYAPNTQPSLLVETFMEGTVHSVDAFVDSSGTPHVLEAVVDYQTGYEIGYDDNFHYSRLLPSKLSAEQTQAIRDVAVLGCQALGIRNSPAHIEVIMTTDGPRIVEIGARNGGYRERMHYLANGLDVTGNAVALALGKQPDVHFQRNEPVGVFELFPRSAGSFLGISNLEQLRALPSCHYVSVKPRLHAHVGKSSQGYKACGIVILHHSDPAQFAHDLEFLNTHVAVQTAS